MNVIITGAARGIGYELVRQFIENGTNKIFIISRNAKKLGELVNYCETVKSKSSIIALPFNLENIDDIKNLAAEVANYTPVIDVLINNAGHLINKPFEIITNYDVELIYKINVFAPFELTRCLIPMLKKSAHGHVVNISSMGGYQGSAKFAGLSAYSSSKAAIACLTECLAEEFNQTQVKFNCLALGAVATEMLAEAFPGYKAPTTATEMAKFIHEFALTGHNMFNGKVLPVSKSTP